MLKLSKLKGKHTGRPGLVLGGGPSLPGDLKIARSVYKNPILIAVNYHALILCKPHYMVYSDDPDSDPSGLMPDFVQNFPGIKVSPDPSSDVIMDVDYWQGMYSSNLAAWLACWMGCDPVLLCGMDCYQGESVYFHTREHDVPSFHYPLDDHLRIWREEGMNKLDTKRLRAVSGPLGNLFGWM